MMQRIQSTRNLIVRQSSVRFMKTPLQLGVLHHTVKALITASRSLKNLTIFVCSYKSSFSHSLQSAHDMHALFRL